MTIKQNGGIFGRNPEYNETTTNDLTVNNDATISSDLTVSGKTALGTTVFSDYTLKIRPQSGATIAGEIDGNLGAGNDNTETEIFRFIGASQTNVRNPRLSIFATRSLTADNRAITLNTYDGGDNARTLKLQSNGALTELGGNLKVPSGSGIDFSATSGTGTSELFDDYEEGTWTPTGNGITLASAYGHYTKVGRLVHVYCQVSFPTTSDTNNANLYGLPYTVGLQSTGHIGYNNFGSGTNKYFVAFSAGTHLRLYDDNGGNSTNATFSGKNVWIATTYGV